jgi:hypothetical protein
MLTQPILYPKMYSTYILLAAMDVLLTALILSIGGIEVNPIANWILSHGEHPALTFFKFGTVAFVLVACEIVGRHRTHLGRNLAEWAIAINTIPVAVALLQLTGVA